MLGERKNRDFMVIMKPSAVRRLLPALLTILALAPLRVAAVPTDYYLYGLGLHRETGRDIYVGAVYLGQHIPRPPDLTPGTAPRVMEYRVVARRTSMRSLLGGMLLQSEVATGREPGPMIAQFADTLLARVKGSLYSGDSLEIRLAGGSETVAFLNGVELARIPDPGIADYLLMGWIGASGPATRFRTDLMAGEINASLLAAMRANRYSSERRAQVAACLAPAQHAPAMDRTGDSPPATPSQYPEGLSIAGNGKIPLQLALLSAGSPLLQEESGVEPVWALGVQEYSHRLARFLGEVVASVHAAIRYPKRAVRRGIEGSLELDVTLGTDGKLLGVSIASSSGQALLDEAAVAAAREALAFEFTGPVDPVAVAEFGAGGNRLVVPVPVSFRLM